MPDLDFEFDYAWLEIKSSNNRGCLPLALDGNAASLPKIYEILETADRTNSSMKEKHPKAESAGLWDYSVRLTVKEARDVHGAKLFDLPNVGERSISFSRNLLYKGSCYTLTLFVEIKA